MDTKVQVYLIALCLVASFQTSSSVPSNYKCEDGIDNLLTVASTSKDLPIVLKHTTILAYDAQMQPSCYKGKPNVVLPGYFIVTGGELITKKDLNVVDNGQAMMSINIDGDDICSTGGSDKFYMPDWICQFEVTTLIPKELIEVLQHSGTHTIEELQDKIDFNTTLPLPESPSVLGLSLIDLFKGIYKVRAVLVSNKERVVDVLFQEGGKPFQLGMYDET
ncbi:hypothetical protein WR25_25470 [Diploscapter pachys]|uniref:Uncharacterized protein n=1 Tax=Diploscapter pachys TaxID=2018661 RepID=A0A2A2JNR5_9BILA|nr:hypothetical protein WR25_25470 [Diploscapter pachys]